MEDRVLSLIIRFVNGNIANLLLLLVDNCPSITFKLLNFHVLFAVESSELGTSVQRHGRALFFTTQQI